LPGWRLLIIILALKYICMDGMVTSTIGYPSQYPVFRNAAPQ